jgi:hypothetical protein
LLLIDYACLLHRSHINAELVGGNGAKMNTASQINSMRIAPDSTNGAALDRLVPVSEALGILGIGMTKFYSEVSLGNLAMLKNGRRSLVRSSEIQRYVDALPRARITSAA